MRRSMVFAAQGLVTLLPLLLVVAAIDPFRDRAFDSWLVDGMSLQRSSATPLERLFAGQHQIEHAAGALSLALLALVSASPPRCKGPTKRTGVCLRRAGASCGGGRHGWGR
ncbi:hypothetical protein ACFQZC_37495 [Streptacidiphilus monticola]